MLSYNKILTKLCGYVILIDAAVYFPVYYTTVIVRCQLDQFAYAAHDFRFLKVGEIL